MDPTLLPGVERPAQAVEARSAPLKPQQVWAIWFWLHQDGRVPDRAVFDLAIDSKLRGCDVVKMLGSRL
jgi:hypothetical protein